jgi:uncharacterized MAPEG superfamily protein
MPVATLPAELLVLGLSIVLLFVHIAFQGVLATLEKGRAWNAGPRDGDTPPKGPLAGRAQRALDNYKETWPAYVALALALALTRQTGGPAETGAWLWLCARLVYLPLYLFGVPYVRSIAWIAAAFGLGMMLVALF